MDGHHDTPDDQERKDEERDTAPRRPASIADPDRAAGLRKLDGTLRGTPEKARRPSVEPDSAPRRPAAQPLVNIWPAASRAAAEVLAQPSEDTARRLLSELADGLHARGEITARPPDEISVLSATFDARKHLAVHIFESKFADLTFLDVETRAALPQKVAKVDAPVILGVCCLGDDDLCCALFGITISKAHTAGGARA